MVMMIVPVITIEVIMIKIITRTEEWGCKDVVMYFNHHGLHQPMEQAQVSKCDVSMKLKCLCLKMRLKAPKNQVSGAWTLDYFVKNELPCSNSSINSNSVFSSSFLVHVMRL